jgi:hypothetical protein
MVLAQSQSAPVINSSIANANLLSITGSRFGSAVPSVTLDGNPVKVDSSNVDVVLQIMPTQYPPLIEPWL